jgi:hypothetical protein
MDSWIDSVSSCDKCHGDCIDAGAELSQKLRLEERVLLLST